MRPIGSHAPGHFAHRALTLRIIALLLAMLPVISGTAASTTLAREAEAESVKGPAVQGPRSQADRKLYREAMQAEIRAITNLTVVEGGVE